MPDLRWIFLIFVSFTLQAEEVISWGNPDHGNGIRAGLSILKISGELQLRMTFQNVGEEDVDVFLYSRTGVGPAYFTRFYVVSPNQKKHDTFYSGGVGHVAGHVEPVMTRLFPRENYDLLFSLSQLFAVVDRKHIPLQELLSKGFIVYASHKVNQESVSWLKRSLPWRGRMTVWVGAAEANYSISQYLKK